MNTTLMVHVTAGGVGIIAGYVALSVAKGATLHRNAGRVFVYAMISMALIGATMAIMRGKAPEANTPIGLLTCYLVLTGLTSVRPPSRGSRWLDRGLMLLVIGVGMTLLAFGTKAVRSPTGTLGGMPAAPFLVFAALALIAGMGDLHMIRSGGVHALRGAPKIARHLWRMTLALAIAAFSFFLGQAKVFPKPMRIYPLLAVPPVVVLVLLLYWLWRVRVRRSLRGVTSMRAAKAV